MSWENGSGGERPGIDHALRRRPGRCALDSAGGCENEGERAPSMWGRWMGQVGVYVRSGERRRRRGVGEGSAADW